jgi:hypothetical protein
LRHPALRTGSSRHTQEHTKRACADLDDSQQVQLLANTDDLLHLGVGDVERTNGTAIDLRCHGGSDGDTEMVAPTARSASARAKQMRARDKTKMNSRALSGPPLRMGEQPQTATGASA